MTLGGAALVTGLIVGGDTGTIIATTGTVGGLIGFNRYLSQSTAESSSHTKTPADGVDPRGLGSSSIT
jgi:hypothetical protein